MRVACQRLVHRYVGREHGGHRAVGWSVEPPRELEQVVQRRSDLAGEDLGAPVPPYAAGYPLPDGRYALARTTYLAQADCLGAVRTETLLVEPAALRDLATPLDLLPALDALPPVDLAAELRAFQRDRTPALLAPLAFELPGPPPPASDLARLRALDPALLAALVEGACGPRPLCLVGDPARDLPLVRALLLLHPRGAAWRAAVCGQALSPRPWADLQLVPRAAADRFALRAARDGDLALVDLATGQARNLEPTPAAAALLDLLARQAWGELDDLARRAGAVAAYRTPADLGAQLRFEALAGAARRAPEEQVELANHLRARGAPEHEVAAPFRALLVDPPEGRLVWLVNVVQAGWLPYRRAHPDAPDDAPEAVQALLLRALAAQRFDLALGFLERCWPLYAGPRAALEEAALDLALGPDPVEPAALPALADLLALAAERAPARAALALHARGLRPPEALARVEAALARAPVDDPDLRRRAGLALVDLAPPDLLAREVERAAAAPWSTPAHLAALTARAPDDLAAAVVAEAPAPWLDEVLRRLPPRALGQAIGALRAARRPAPRPGLRARARRAGRAADAAACRQALLRAGPAPRPRRAGRAGGPGVRLPRAQEARARARAHDEVDDGAMATGFGRLDLNPDPAGGDDTGVNLAVPEDTLPAYRDLLAALATSDGAARDAVGALVDLVPDAALDLPLPDLVRLARRAGDAPALVRAALGRVTDADPDGLAAALDLARALPERRHDLARAVVARALEADLPALEAALVLLDPTRAAADAPLLEALAARARAGRLEVEALLPLGPAGLDGALARLGDGFSLRLQGGLRRLALGLAEAPAGGGAPERAGAGDDALREAGERPRRTRRTDEDRDALLEVVLARLRPHVAADRDFRAGVAEGLRARLGPAAPERLRRAIDAFERDSRA
ncbi:MAG: hypothetical protein M9894_26550 [Planctomycetes bacterium]|nr:hypothetical protein [Planctomycetota bacterium]